MGTCEKFLKVRDLQKNQKIVAQSLHKSASYLLYGSFFHHPAKFGVIGRIVCAQCLAKLMFDDKFFAFELI